MKLLEENIMSSRPLFGQNFLNRTPKALGRKWKIEKNELYQNEKFMFVNKQYKRVIRQATDWVKVFVIDTTGKEQYKVSTDQQE